LKHTCEDAGVILAYLPPYSPDLNPIEEAFAQLKQWFRKHRELADSFANFEDYLRLGLEDTQKAVKGHFRKCRLGRTQPREDDDMEDDFDEHEDVNEYY
jgi:transposase